MSFKLVYYSQQDPQWRADILGFGEPGDTLGEFGCAITSIAMLLSGHGYPETPKTLNEKLKSHGGFQGSYIAWGAVSNVHPQVTLKEHIPCETTDAPLAKIDAALGAGQPVVVRVDSSPLPNLQWHYVLVYARKGNDYLMLDPVPYTPGTAKEDLLMARYSQGQPLQRSIQQVLIYNCSTADGTIAMPGSPAGTTVTPQPQPAPASAPSGGVYARPTSAVTEYVNLRSSTDTSSMVNVIAKIYPGDQVLIVEAGGESKLGLSGQFIRVRDKQGVEGFAAAWFLERVPGAAPASSTGSTPGPASGASGASEAPASTSAANRSRPSIGDGLENIPLEAPAEKRINDNSLLARIWNKYGGLLTSIAGKMNFDPAIAVAILAQESGGQPYGSDGRLIIRFENHLFYEYWGKQNASVYNDHFQTGSPVWTGHRWRQKADAAWRDCHTSQSVEWEVLTFASTLDDTAAKKSISMGLPQVLGSNFGVLGFASVQDMFNAFVASERNQVVAFFDFLQGNGPAAVNALQTRDFRTIASIYNGPGQADSYGGLIAGHYNNFVALRGAQPPVPSTPGSTSASTPATTPSVPAQPMDPNKKYLVVSDAAGPGGTAMRKTASNSAPVQMTLTPGMLLIVIEPYAKARGKLGQQNQWIYVRGPNKKPGYVLSQFVKLP